MSELKDVYKEVPNWRETHKGMNRPEYVLKNGSARNCYGLLKDIHALQKENQRLTEIATKHATRADELYEALECICSFLSEDGLIATGLAKEIVNAQRVLYKSQIDDVSNSNDD